MSLAKDLSIFLINFYQKNLRPFLYPACRFYPSCSEYTKQAIECYGFLKGVVRGLKRLLTCHPFSAKSGYDPLI